MQRIKRFADIVLDIVERHPEAATSYKLLDFYYLREYCGLGWLEREQFSALMKGLSHLSSLNRAYRKLKELGLIRLGPCEEERRAELEAEIRYEVGAWQ